MVGGGGRRAALLMVGGGDDMVWAVQKGGRGPIAIQCPVPLRLGGGPGRAGWIRRETSLRTDGGREAAMSGTRKENTTATEARGRVYRVTRKSETLRMNDSSVGTDDVRDESRDSGTFKGGRW